MSISKKGIGIAVAAIVGVVLIYVAVLSWVMERAMTGQLRDVFTQQANIFTPTLVDMAGEQPTATLQCTTTAFTHWQTRMSCQDFQNYAYNFTALPDSGRPRIEVDANKLDQLLKQAGWSPDKPHSPTTTVRASIPTTPLAAYYSGGVPFHKNIGSISCNLEVDFSGPTDGASPGTININEFSCQQDVSYFMPHLTSSQNAAPEFGG